MSLQNKLDQLRQQSESGKPPEALAIMHRATDDLLSSGIMEGVLKVGSRSPEFTLSGTNKEPVDSTAMLGKGPLVVSFYRGAW